MKKLKMREVALLVLPVVLLVGIGFILRSQLRSQHTEKFAVIVTSVKTQSATPLEVSQGYDTKVTLAIGYRGPEPAWWHSKQFYPQTQYLEDQNGKTYMACGPTQFPFDGERLRYLRFERGQYLIDYLVTFSEVPSTAGKVTLKATMRWSRMPPITVSAVIREEGARVLMPAVSKYCPLRLVKSEVKKIRPGEALSLEDTEVTLIIKSLEALPQDGKPDLRWAWQKPDLVDEKGRSYKGSYWIGDTSFFEPVEGGYAKTFRMNLSQVPANVRKLFFKTGLSLNDCWPLPISVIVRDTSKTPRQV